MQDLCSLFSELHHREDYVAPAGVVVWTRVVRGVNGGAGRSWSPRPMPAGATEGFCSKRMEGITALPCPEEDYVAPPGVVVWTRVVRRVNEYTGRSWSPRPMPAGATEGRFTLPLLTHSMKTKCTCPTTSLSNTCVFSKRSGGATHSSQHCAMAFFTLFLGKLTP